MKVLKNNLAKDDIFVISSGLGHPSTTYPSQVLRLPHTYPRPGVSSLSSLFLFGPPIGLVSQYI
jgi:hypothetical protein